MVETTGAGSREAASPSTVPTCTVASIPLLAWRAPFIRSATAVCHFRCPQPTGRASPRKAYQPRCPHPLIAPPQQLPLYSLHHACSSRYDDKGRSVGAFCKAVSCPVQASSRHACQAGPSQDMAGNAYHHWARCVVCALKTVTALSLPGGLATQKTAHQPAWLHGMR
jgi:hypothetical protein